MIDWKECHEDGTVPWHVRDVNKMLLKGFPVLSDTSVEGKSIFVPLCGKSIDLKWLYDRGMRVFGVEFVEKGIINFFNENGITFAVEKHENYDVYVSTDSRMKLFRSDLFYLNHNHYGEKFDYLWDRGSLVALDKVDHKKYAGLISVVMKDNSAGLLEVFEYDKSLRDGPPASVFKEDLEKLYDNSFQFREVSRQSSSSDAEADCKLGVNEFTVLYKMSRV